MFMSEGPLIDAAGRRRTAVTTGELAVVLQRTGRGRHQQTADRVIMIC
jgi:hypothetical protein